MRVFLLLVALTACANAQSFSGGYVDGAMEAERLELQRRALELDGRDGGNRYNALRRQHEMEELNRHLRRQNELLEQLRRDRMILGR